MLRLVDTNTLQNPYQCVGYPVWLANPPVGKQLYFPGSSPGKYFTCCVHDPSGAIIVTARGMPPRQPRVIPRAD